MKLLIFLFLFLLNGCDEKSSPEGRLTGKLDKLQKEIETLKEQNAVMMDSIHQINQELRVLKSQRKL